MRANIPNIPPQNLDPVYLLDLIEIEKEKVRRHGLREFVRQAWHITNPGKGIRDVNGRYWPIWNWHLDAVSDHFEAFVKGDITRLIINVPPRSTKSTTGSVAAPVFSWLTEPNLQFLTTSYRDDLSTRDAVKSRRLVQHPWFKERWGEIFQLVGDQNQKTRYENNMGGYRIAQSVGSGSTGEGGDRIVVDDPHNVKRAESEVERQNAIDWWDEEMSTRLNDILTGGLAIIMQRLHEKDLTGHVLAKDAGYVHLMIPAEYEPERACTTVYVKKKVVRRKNRLLKVSTKVEWTDPRTEDGEVIDEKRFSFKALKDLKKRMNPYSIAGQLQQRPAPRRGAMFDVDLIQLVTAVPAGIGATVRYWDKAGTEARLAKAGYAHTAGALMARINSGPQAGKFIILNIIRGQWAAGPRETIIRNTAEKDGKQVVVWVEQEPGSGGKESAENTVANLAGWTVHADRVTGDKQTRAEPLAAQTSVGNILMFEAHWNDELIKELRVFPVGAGKDQVDCVAGAFNKVSMMKPKRMSW